VHPISDPARLEAVPSPTGPAAPAGPPPESTAGSPYQPCDDCGAPLDERQRYCVACGARRRHAEDPAARFLAEATRRRRSSGAGPAATARTAAAARGRRSAPLAIAAAIAAVPLALGAGVLIGRSSGGGNGKLIAALRAEKAPVIEYAGGGGAPAGPQSAAVASADTSPPTSTFTLSHGYTVQLGTLPSGTFQPAVASVERADQAKGATGVGLIALSAFKLTPSPSTGAYVVYSGSYPTRVAAQSALKKLKTKFPAAKVVEVRSSGGASASKGKVLNTTRYGSAHQVTNYKPSSSSLSQGAQVANKDSHATGQTASGAGLPDVVSVP
jgi:SPOR domain